MRYLRPETVQEAVELLSEGVPLGGGTTLAPRRRTLDAVIDLDKLGLDQIEINNTNVAMGAGTKLQMLIEPDLDLPAEFKRVCKLEAAWNLRNMASVAGTIMSADGRSPLLVVLLALGTVVSIFGEDTDVSLNEVLDQRAGDREPFLIERVHFPQPSRLSYEYVARAPADRPLVSAAAALSADGSRTRVAVGGFSTRPLLLEGDPESSPEHWQALANESYADAGDAFASAEYRSEVVSILVARVVKEVQA
jgi:CO/xanthine dehydrogenase FAD-binding subunit